MKTKNNIKKRKNQNKKSTSDKNFININRSKFHAPAIFYIDTLDDYHIDITESEFYDSVTFISSKPSNDKFPATSNDDSPLASNSESPVASNGKASIKNIILKVSQLTGFCINCLLAIIHSLPMSLDSGIYWDNDSMHYMLNFFLSFLDSILYYKGDRQKINEILPFIIILVIIVATSTVP